MKRILMVQVQELGLLDFDLKQDLAQDECFRCDFVHYENYNFLIYKKK
jgi:hypothetical protein